MSKKQEALHWADNIAREVAARVDREPILQKIVKKEGYIVYDEKTPSGEIHIGSGRGWVIHDAIAKAMRDLGLKGRFILSADDIDPFDKIPSNLDTKKYQQYLGIPIRNIPSPEEGFESYADYYFKQSTEKFVDYGIDAELQSTGEVYESGKFNKAMKTILNNSDKVKAVFERIYDKEYDKLPINMICEKCGKIGTTRAISWDKEKELVKYKCEEDLVGFAEGCGYEGEATPYNGNSKFPWKVEWAAKWPTVGVVCEFAGKDHFTKGGSRDVAIAISNEVLNFPPPYPSTRTSIGKGYEFFNIGGRKMSTSHGIGAGFAEMTKYVPAKILRFLLVRSRPHSVIDFDPQRSNDIILLYERYDKTERIYFGKEKLDNEQEVMNHKRIYELAHIGDIPKKIPIQIPLAYAAAVSQIGMDDEGALNILRRTGHVPEKLKGIDLHYVLERLHDSQCWVAKFAPEQYKFKLQTKIPKSLQLTVKQKQALKEVASLLDKDWEEKELHDQFYNIGKNVDIKIGEFFKAAYQVLINKDQGPRLASFILTIGKDKVKSLFDSL